MIFSWKFERLEPGSTNTSQYVGGFNYANCNDGHVTATDRVFQPAIGATTATECPPEGAGWPVTAVRTN